MGGIDQLEVIPFHDVGDDFQHLHHGDVASDTGSWTVTEGIEVLFGRGAFAV